MKIIILTIPIIAIFLACNSLSRDDLTTDEAFYEKGNYKTTRDICEAKLFEDPYNKLAVKILKKIY